MWSLGSGRGAGGPLPEGLAQRPKTQRSGAQAAAETASQARSASRRSVPSEDPVSHIAALAACAWGVSDGLLVRCSSITLGLFRMSMGRIRPNYGRSWTTFGAISAKADQISTNFGVVSSRLGRIACTPNPQPIAHPT